MRKLKMQDTQRIREIVPIGEREALMTALEQGKTIVTADEDLIQFLKSIGASWVNKKVVYEVMV